MTGAGRIARFAIDLGGQDMPAAVTEAACWHLLDAIGVGLAAGSGGSAGRWRAVADAPGPATLFGGGSTTPDLAAMVNGALIHALEYDDTHIASVIHGSAVAAPVALAAAELSGASGAEMLAAYVIAWEVMIRIGLATPGAFQARGFQVTAVAGAVGAAAAAGRLAGLDEDALSSAIGIAGSEASGTMTFLADGASVKALHPGWAARTGLTAVRLARAGMTGPVAALEGRFGVMECFAGDVGSSLAQLSTLGAEWHLPQAAFKLYPCCHYIHPFLEALDALRCAGLRADALARLTAFVPPPVAPLICEPWDRRQAPASGYDAKWALGYCLGLMMTDGAVGIADFEAPPRADVIAVARRIRWLPMEDHGFPARFPARLVADLSDGSRREAFVDTVLGAPDRPVPPGSVSRKFHANASRALSRDQANNLFAAVMGLPTAPDLSILAGALSP